LLIVAQDFPRSSEGASAKDANESYVPRSAIAPPLLVFSGSGNSRNILRALEEAQRLGMKSFAVLGFDGGKAKAMCDVPIHFAVDDMQIAEDVQLILGHMIVQHLHAHRDGLGRP
jgi:D-arabinose 5-phosphate isomerase GutQ